MKIKYSLIGGRIATRRKQLKLTQAELAEKTELTPRYISKIETSEDTIPSILSVLKLCVALGVSPNFLLFGISDDVEPDDYSEVAQKMKLCDAKQLRQVSQIIDVIIGE